MEKPNQKRSLFRRLFRRPAVWLVKKWAGLAYAKGVRAAEQRHRDEVRRTNVGACIVYLAADSWRPDHLITYTKAQFKTEKRVYGRAAQLLTMMTLRRGCYYHTADRWGRNSLTPKEKERRKQAFIKERLQLAKLV